MKKKKATTWAGALAERVREQAEQAGERPKFLDEEVGWKTFEEVLSELNSGDRSMGSKRLHAILRSMIESGEVEVRECWFTKPGGVSRTRSVFYRLKDEK